MVTMSGQKLNIKNVLITGGGGKIGRAAIPKLLDAGFRLRATQLPDEPVDFEDVERVTGTLADETLVETLMEDMDAVIHLANVKENRDLFMDSNVKGTFYLLDAAMRCGHIKQFVQAGSDARAGIYYYPRPIPIAENHRHSGYPGYYPLSKILEETMVEQYIIMYNLPATVLRFSWVFDEDDVIAHATLKEPNFGVPIWEELAATPEQKTYFEKNEDAVACMLNSDGSPSTRHVVGIKDVVQSILLALGNPATLGEAFNVCGPAPFSYKLMADDMAEKLDLPVVEFTNPEFHNFCIDLSKSRSVLGYKPEYDIFKIVDDAVAFRKAGRKRTPMKYIG
jgi:UDP-glucose 4-epimerase